VSVCVRERWCECVCLSMRTRSVRGSKHEQLATPPSQLLADSPPRYQPRSCLRCRYPPVLSFVWESHQCRNVKRFRGGLVCKAHRHLYHSTLGLIAIKKKKKNRSLVSSLRAPLIKLLGTILRVIIGLFLTPTESNDWSHYAQIFRQDVTHVAF